MAQCVMTGKKIRSANHVSHANNHTKRKQYANVHSKRIYVPELDRTVRLSISARALRSITRIGLVAYARKQGLDLNRLIGA